MTTHLVRRLHHPPSTRDPVRPQLLGALWAAALAAVGTPLVVAGGVRAGWAVASVGYAAASWIIAAVWGTAVLLPWRKAVAQGVAEQVHATRSMRLSPAEARAIVRQWLLRAFAVALLATAPLGAFAGYQTGVRVGSPGAGLLALVGAGAAALVVVADSGATRWICFRAATSMGVAVRLSGADKLHR